MPNIELPFADGFYQSESSPLLDKRVVNLYPAIPEADAPTKKSLFHTSGIDEVSNAGSKSSRGVFKFSDGIIYRVIGNTLYSFDAGNNRTSRGTITGTSDVSMDSNGINIAIVDPTGDSYFFTPSSNTLELSDSAAFLGFGQATSVTFKDGFYAYTTDRVFFASSAKTVNDGKTFNSLDFADAEISPDLIIKGWNDHNQLYIMGDHLTEVYRTIITTGFVFERIDGAMIPKGCAARNCVVSFDGSFLFLGGGQDERPTIYRAVGSSVERISTKAIDRVIHGYSDDVISEARMFSYAEDGNYFAVLTIGDNTFVYNHEVTKLTGIPSWHERQTGVTNAVGFQRWRAIHGIEAFGKIQVADDRSGLVGNLNKDTFKEYGNTIERFFSTKPFQDKGNYMFSKQIELYMRVGVGNADVENPVIRMDYSDDGSNTFKNEIPKSMGKVGEYKKRVKWKRLGRIPNTRTMRWKTTEPVPVDIYGLFANGEVTANG